MNTTNMKLSTFHKASEDRLESAMEKHPLSD